MHLSHLDILLDVPVPGLPGTLHFWGHSQAMLLLWVLGCKVRGFLMSLPAFFWTQVRLAMTNFFYDIQMVLVQATHKMGILR